MSISVSLLGASGLIGQHCLELLLADAQISQVTSLSRRPLDLQHPKLNNVVGELDDMHSEAQAFAADCLICCLGTTIKTAGSKSAFRQVDYDYVCQAADIARQQGCEAMIVISAVGADSKSVFFYNKVKGQMENQLQTLGFDSLSIIRPSLLLGERRERRLAEDLSKPFTQALAPLLIGQLKRYQPVQGSSVAQQIVNLCKQPPKGVKIVYPTL